MKNTKSGFTLVEIVLVTALLAVTIAGMIRLFIFTSVQAEVAGDQTLAVSAAQAKLEEIRNYKFDDIVSHYSVSGTMGNTFPITGINGNGMGLVEIDNSNPDLLVIEVTACWSSKYNRIIGEDTNFDGVLDPGEDVNSNGEMDSPVKLMSMLTRR